MTRLNRLIQTLEDGGTAFLAFCQPSVQDAVSFSTSPYEGLIIEMEHLPFSATALRDHLQHLLSRASILEHGPAPSITPFVRIPANGAENNEWMAKQVLDLGAFGVVWPHIETAEQAHHAVAACRYPGAAGGGSGRRGYRPNPPAARYFGVTGQEYRTRAGVWPLDPGGEIVVVLLVESTRGLDNLEQIVSTPGAGVVMLGLGDLAAELGPSAAQVAPDLMSAALRALEVCSKAGIPCGVSVSGETAEEFLAHDFRFVVVQPEISYQSLGLARRAVGRRAGVTPPRA